LRRLLETPERQRPDEDDLLRRVAMPGDLVRDRLAGDAIDTLISLLLRAKREGGRCLCALYELSDPELVDELRAAVGHVEVILSAADRGIYDGANSGMRHRLRRAIGDALHDRMLPDGHLGHNKFVVYLDKDGAPLSVLTGSTNWTPTGLCTQTNNALLIEDGDIATRFRDQWDALLADGAKQAKPLRDANEKTPPDQSLGDAGGTVRVWFSPNTKNHTVGDPQTAKTPPDMADLYELIDDAKDGVLFLVFNPGGASILNHIKLVGEQRRQAGERFFVRGAISDLEVAKTFATRVYNDSILEAPNLLVTGIGAVRDRYAYWEAELMKVGHAAIHDKVLVIDPFSDGCTVATGSHNLGFKASYANDENMCIIRGNAAIARAYAAHVLDVVNHFNWRAKLSAAATAAPADHLPDVADDRHENPFVGLATDDEWQDKYFRGSFLKNRDLFFFPN
jgi:phosphatidylserine/phosphatidylglycerophosphate/cardiolipin synthase-like enzyme